MKSGSTVNENTRRIRMILNVELKHSADQQPHFERPWDGRPSASDSAL